jgi:flagellar basal-body rod modification protein FlgD
MTTPISGTTNTGATTTAKSTSIAGGMSADDFMKLLLAQLKYQDPSKPTDVTQQMAQLSGLTQVQKLNDLVTAQTEALALQKRMSAAAAIGKEASGTTADGKAVSGVVKGVSYAGDSPVLELSDGSKLAMTAVQRLGAATA